VPGMGDKISVLIHFSFVFFVKIIHNTLHWLFGKGYLFFQQNSLTLYLKEK
jgi:hypothetical protein